MSDTLRSFVSRRYKGTISQAALDERIERLYAGLNVSHTRQDIDDFALIDWEEEEDWLDP